MDMIDDMLNKFDEAHPTLCWYLLRFTMCVFLTLFAVSAVCAVGLVILFFVALIKGSLMCILWIILTPIAVFVTWALFGTINIILYYL